jgi:hypothetical protein
MRQDGSQHTFAPNQPASVAPSRSCVLTATFACVRCLRASKGEFAALETQTQLLYSLVDQRLFGPQPLPDGHDPLSSDFLAHMQRQVRR